MRQLAREVGRELAVYAVLALAVLVVPRLARAWRERAAQPVHRPVDPAAVAVWEVLAQARAITEDGAP